MFEQEINETIQRITRDVLQDKTLIPLVEILKEPLISNRFKAFFETEAHWWIYTETLSRKRDRRFDFSHPEIASLLSYLEQIQAKHAQFEREDFLSVLDGGVKLTYNYVCRPQTTLKWYVFRGEPTKPLGETLLRMNAFVDYPYFRTVFTDWVDRKREERPTFDSISAREFERIIRRIDDQILLSCTIEELLEIISPLFDFIGKGEARSVPIDALIVYFDDKHIAKLVEFLERVKEQKTHVTLESFEDLMEELLNSAHEEPEADFSSVYQDDALDEVVREHLQGDGVHEGEVMEAVQEVESVMVSSSEQLEVESEDVVEVENDDEAPEPIEKNNTEKEQTNEPDEASAEPGYIEEQLEEEDDGDSFFIGLTPLDDETESEELVSIEPDDDELETATEPIIDILIEPANDEQIIVGEKHDFTFGDAYQSKEENVEVAVSEEESEQITEVELEEKSEGGDEDKPDHIEEGSVDEDETPRPELDDVSLHIDAMLERKVVKKIFARNRESYEGTLEELNNASSWRDASKVLDELFIRFDVDPYSRTAIRFTDAIYGRYLATGMRDEG